MRDVLSVDDEIGESVRKFFGFPAADLDLDLFFQLGLHAQSVRKFFYFPAADLDLDLLLLLVLHAQSVHMRGHGNTRGYRALEDTEHSKE